MVLDVLDLFNTVVSHSRLAPRFAILHHSEFCESNKPLFSAQQAIVEI